MTRHEHGTNPRRRADRWSKGPAQPGAPEPALPAPVAPAAFELQRRSFLRLAGFGFLAAGAAACSRGPSQKAVALLAPSEDVIPGRNYRIATTTWSDGTGSGVLLTCRDGRPIKVEGNPAHPCGRGALSPVAQASILSLYDGLRLDGPRLSGRGATWDEADAWL
ncbi:MAG: hypothetical protein FJ296_09260, partial [Planctomycetes bacterium]|nr:hypothetical protein [Planctomycetota bacterium]